MTKTNQIERKVLGHLVAGTLLGIGIYLRYLNRQKKRRNNQNQSTTPLRITTTTKQGILTAPDWSSPFDQNYIDDVIRYLAPKRIRIMSEITAKQYAKKLRNAKGYIIDDEKIVKQIFQRLLRDKTEVSLIAKVFYKSYKKDLWQHLNSFLSSTELHEYVTKPVLKLDKYQILRP